MKRWKLEIGKPLHKQETAAKPKQNAEDRTRAKSKVKDSRHVSREEVEARINRVLSAYRSMEQMIDSLPDKLVPEVAKKTVKKMLLDNKKVNDFLYALEHRRAPRFLVVGRTGVGKSSLINAMLGTYAAQTSAVEIGTQGVVRHEYRVEGETLIEVLDTRGVGESFGDGERDAQSAESALNRAIKEFAPDAVLFVLPCAGRDRLNQDARVVEKILKGYEREFHVKVPVFVVLNRADEVEPVQERNPKEFSERKLSNMRQAVDQAKRVLTEQNIEYADIRAVSSYIDWGYPPEEIEAMSEEQRENLEIVYDGRYQMDELMKALVDNLQVEASMGLVLVGQAEEVLSRLAMEIVGVFTLAAGGVPIKNEVLPVGDNAALTAMQAIMVLFIAIIGGTRMTFQQATQYLLGFGGTLFSGKLFRATSHAMSKGAVFFIRRFCPVIPQRISELFINCGVAGGGTAIIGIASVRHFIQGISITKVKDEWKEAFGEKVKTPLFGRKKEEEKELF